MEKILEHFWQEKRKADAEYNKTQNKYYEGVSDGMLYCINEIQHSANVLVSSNEAIPIKNKKKSEVAVCPRCKADTSQQSYKWNWCNNCGYFRL